jgi:hypothetical protein
VAIVLACAVLATVALAGGAAGCGSTDVASSTTAKPVSTISVQGAAATDSEGTATTKVQTSTTAKASSTTTEESATTTTTKGTPTTSAGSSSTDSSTDTSAALSPALQKYKSDMSEWAAVLQTLPEGDPLEITDVVDTSQVDVDAAVEFASAVHGLLDQLKAVKPPAEVTPAHEKLVDVITDMIAVTDRAVEALKNKDQTAMDAAQAEKAAIEDRTGPVLEALAPFLGG